MSIKFWENGKSKKLIRHYFHSGINTPIGYGITHGFKHFVTTFFYGIFPFTIDDNGTLFSLFFSMAADFYQTFNYPFKGIYVIIPAN